jgi:hypothetical protein
MSNLLFYKNKLDFVPNIDNHSDNILTFATDKFQKTVEYFYLNIVFFKTLIFSMLQKYSFHILMRNQTFRKL